jgi:hypothetical protein
MALFEPRSSRLDGRNGWTPLELRRVVVRMSGGEVLQVGVAPNRESALVIARTAIAEIEAPRGKWPLVDGSAVRRESIVSVDVLTSRP